MKLYVSRGHFFRALAYACLCDLPLAAIAVVLIVLLFP